jgi:hypothetical protein
MWADLGKVLAGAAVVIVLGVVFGLWNVDLNPTKRPTPRPDATYLDPDEHSPREFLYLDNTRAEAYLSQLSGGNQTLRKISETVSGKAGAELALGALKVSGEAARENALEQTVTPTTASNFYALTQRLKDFHELVSLPEPDVSGSDDVTESGASSGTPSADGSAPRGNALFAERWHGVREGDIVRIRAEIRRPTFVRLYETLRQAPPDSRLGRQGASLLKAIGDQPRLPLVIEVVVPNPKHRDGTTGAATQVLRLVMPVQAANLAQEPSLFAPRMTVVGKVVRRVDPGEHYRDLSFFSRFRPVLTLTPAVVRKRLNTPLKRLSDELLSYRTLHSPAAVILPIAIYL